jgi:Ca-activated chloride channel family protein
MPGFKEPLWLAALAVIPVLAGVYYYVLRKKKQEAIAFSRVAYVKSALADTKKSRRTQVIFFLALAAIGLLVIGLADPHIPLQQTKAGMNVIMVIDDSGSMQATDYQPSRIEAAKSAAENLVGDLGPEDSAGVIIFNTGATTVAYLSTDKAQVQEKISDIAPSDGSTAIGDGLALAVDMAESVPDKQSVIILLSDGVNNAGVISPDDASALAKAAGVPVYTIGLGTASQTIVGNDWEGNPEYAGLNETALESIADRTGGKYFKSVDAQTLNNVYTGLTPKLAPTTEETSIREWFMVAALVLLCAELWLRYGPGRIIP